MSWLAVATDGSEPLQHLVMQSGKSYTIGRHGGCDMAITNDTSVSRLQLSMEVLHKTVAANPSPDRATTLSVRNRSRFGVLINRMPPVTNTGVELNPSRVYRLTFGESSRILLYPPLTVCWAMDQLETTGENKDFECLRMGVMHVCDDANDADDDEEDVSAPQPPRGERRLISVGNDGILTVRFETEQDAEEWQPWMRVCNCKAIVGIEKQEKQQHATDISQRRRRATSSSPSSMCSDDQCKLRISKRRRLVSGVQEPSKSNVETLNCWLTCEKASDDDNVENGTIKVVLSDELVAKERSKEANKPTFQQVNSHLQCRVPQVIGRSDMYIFEKPKENFQEFK